MTDIITLKEICAELEITSRVAREKLRAAAADKKNFPELSKDRKPNTSWQWIKGSAGEKEARTALAG